MERPHSTPLKQQRQPRHHRRRTLNNNELNRNLNNTTTHNNTQQHTTKQVAYVALAVKQGSQVSDMRHHAYKGRLRGAQLVYFRANDAGACGYFEDSR